MSDQLGREAIRKCSLSPLGTCSVCEAFRLCRYLLRPQVQVSCQGVSIERSSSWRPPVELKFGRPIKFLNRNVH